MRARVDYKETCHQSVSDEFDHLSLQESSFSTHNTISVEGQSADCITERKVRFSGAIELHPYLSRQSYSQTETKKSFYTKQEISRIKARRNRIIKKIDQGQNKNKDSTRGLEYWIQQTSGDIDRRVDGVIDNVMDEQDDQMMAGVCYPYLIAQASMKISQESEMVAIERAQQDMLAAWNANRDMTKVKSTPSIRTATTVAMSCSLQPRSLEPPASPARSRRSGSSSRNKQHKKKTKMKRKKESSEKTIDSSTQQQKPEYPDSSLSSTEDDECLASTRKKPKKQHDKQLILDDETIEDDSMDAVEKPSFRSWIRNRLAAHSFLHTIPGSVVVYSGY